MSRRSLIRSSVAAAVFASVRFPLGALGFQDPGADETIIPFLDARQIKPKKDDSLDWNELKSWLISTDRVYHVSHYGTQQLKAEDHELVLDGLFQSPMRISLDEIKARPRKTATLTLECGGNGAGLSFMGAIANVKWTGTPLAPLLKEAGLKPEAVEVAFWGADKGKEKVREIEVEQHFARSLSLRNALRDDVLLCYEMNGAPLTAGHGFPLRLIVPGWYGIAWVKWLTRIEARDRALMTRFMAKDYVTLRGEQHGDEIVWKQNSVGPMNVKSMVARCTRSSDGSLNFTGAAWSDGTPIKRVEVKVDDGPWEATRLSQPEQNPFAWTFWTYRWNNPAAGEHTIVSRAIDEKDRVQPSADDPQIRLKKTYWEANQQFPRKFRI